MTKPLLITADEDLREDVSRLAAAAGVDIELARAASVAMGSWASASMVLVGTDLAGELAATQPPRREQAYVLCRAGATHDVFEVALRLGAESVVALPESEGWLVETLTDAGDVRATRGHAIGVLGGAGGAGATTFACALAQVVSARSAALLIDADAQGPGVDRVLGMEDVHGVRWDSLMRTTGRLSARSVRDSVPRRGDLGVVTWRPGPRGTLPSYALREVVSAGLRGHEYVLLDLPRTHDELTQEAVSRCALVAVVVPASVTGVASAAQVVAGLPPGVEAGLVVRGERFKAADVTAAVRRPVLAMMPDTRGLMESLDLGLGPVRSTRGALPRAANQVMEQLHGSAA